MNHTEQKDKKLKQYLSRHKVFRKEIIRNYYARNGELVSDPHLRVMINRLKTKGVITAVGRDLYRLQDKKIFAPELAPAIKRIASLLRINFPSMNNMIWSTQWLNDLTILQLMRNIVIVEVESGSEGSVFLHLKNIFPNAIFLDPSETEWENYRSEKENIIVKSMISESPSLKYQSVKIASIEKILVDIYCDKIWKIIFSSELHTIYVEACKNLSINFTTLLGYAARRNKRSEIWEFIRSLQVLDNKTIEMIEK